MASASILFGFGGVLVRLAYDHGANVRTILAARAIGGLPWLVLFASSTRRRLARESWIALLAMGLVLSANLAMFFTAVSRMSPALVSLIYYTYPPLVIAGAHILGWNKFNLFTGVAASATLFGVVLTIGVPEDGGVSTLAIVLSIGTAICQATYILLAQFALQRVDAATCLASVSAVSSTVVLLATVPFGASVPTNWTSIMSLVGLLAVTSFSQIFLLSGVAALGGPLGAIAACLEVVTTVVAAAIIFGIPTSSTTLLGASLIVAGGLAAPIAASYRNAT
jgi:drug/metabolite transporter (DMT)-like permease